ncbi:hypothetical protein KEM55_000576, partial [Ascosphaera atra]
MHAFEGDSDSSGASGKSGQSLRRDGRHVSRAKVKEVPASKPCVSAPTTGNGTSKTDRPQRSRTRGRRGSRSASRQRPEIPRRSSSLGRTSVREPSLPRSMSASIVEGQTQAQAQESIDAQMQAQRQMQGPMPGAWSEDPYQQQQPQAPTQAAVTAACRLPYNGQERNPDENFQLMAKNAALFGDKAESLRRLRLEELNPNSPLARIQTSEAGTGEQQQHRTPISPDQYAAARQSAWKYSSANQNHRPQLSLDTHVASPYPLAPSMTTVSSNNFQLAPSLQSFADNFSSNVELCQADCVNITPHPMSSVVVVGQTLQRQQTKQQQQLPQEVEAQEEEEAQP